MAVQLERQQRRNARGDRQARDGNQTKLITNAQKERSENSQGKLRLNQQVAREQQQQRIAEARARCASDIQRKMLSPESVVPNGKLIVQLNDVILPFGDFVARGLAPLGREAFLYYSSGNIELPGFTTASQPNGASPFATTVHSFH